MIRRIAILVAALFVFGAACDPRPYRSRRSSSSTKRTSKNHKPVKKTSHAKHEHSHSHPHGSGEHHHHPHPHPHLTGEDGHHHPY